MVKYPCHDEQDIRQHDIDSFDVMLPAPLQVGGYVCICSSERKVHSSWTIAWFKNVNRSYA